VVIARGDIYWVDLAEPEGHEPAKRRPVVVVQSEAFNQSLIGTVIVVALTSNTQAATKPGNVFLPAADSGLNRDSVANVSQILTMNKYELIDRVGQVPFAHLRQIDTGLRLVLDL
jgi:mRNA interferase MazF